MNDLRSRNHLIMAGRLYPEAWRQAEQFRAARDRGLPDWPNWCFLPMAGWYAVVSADAGVDRLTPAQSGDIGRLAALGAWRMTQGIYRYDPTLYGAIKSTPVAGDIPCAVLYRLPEWCIYVETPGMTHAASVLHGFFAHLEYDVNDGRHELRLLLDTDDGLTPIPLHLGSWPLDEAVERMVAESVKQGAPSDAAGYVTRIREEIEPLVSLILYICTEAAEIGDGAAKPRNPRSKKTKGGLRLFGPDKPLIWDIGVRLGSALRKAFQDSAGNREPEGSGRSRPRPHVRRAHWHTYLYGSGRDEPKLKWLPPIPVNVEDLDALPSVIKKVKK